MLKNVKNMYFVFNLTQIGKKYSLSNYQYHFCLMKTLLWNNITVFVTSLLFSFKNSETKCQGYVWHRSKMYFFKISVKRVPSTFRKWFSLSSYTLQCIGKLKLAEKTMSCLTPLDSTTISLIMNNCQITYWI